MLVLLLPTWYLIVQMIKGLKVWEATELRRAISYY